MARVHMQVGALTGQSAIPVRRAGVTAAQTWVRGAVLVFASGLLSEGGTDPTDIAGLAVYKEPPTNTPSDNGQFIPALPSMEFIASVDDSASLGTGTSAVTDIGTAYGITEDSDGVWYVDKNKTGATVVRVVVTELFEDAAGTINGRVKFRFLPVIDLAGTPTAVTAYSGN